MGDKKPIRLPPSIKLIIILNIHYYVVYTIEMFTSFAKGNTNG